MKSYLLFFVFFLIITLSSCEPRAEDNVRILVKGQVVDQDGNAISNAEIKVYTEIGSFFSSGDPYLLGRGVSESNGNFSVVSFFDADEDFSVHVQNGEDYSEYIYQTNTSNYTPPGLTFNLGTVDVIELAQASININRVSSQGTTLSYYLIYPTTYCWEYYDEGVLNETYSYCFLDTSLGGSLNDDNPDGSRSFQTLVGSTVEFTYSIDGQPEETQFLTIDQENYEFNFSY